MHKKLKGRGDHRLQACFYMKQVHKLFYDE